VLIECVGQELYPGIIIKKIYYLNTPTYEEISCVSELSYDRIIGRIRGCSL
jgi:hypothetical protein